MSTTRRRIGIIPIIFFPISLPFLLFMGLIGLILRCLTFRPHRRTESKPSDLYYPEVRRDIPPPFIPGVTAPPQYQAPMPPPPKYK